ncbi:MAG: alpha/beta fold hydrolase, partial [Myxococcales bacterium]|nr:alpha/beta fold hydrolase [Myxococcales bacterium]
MKQVYVADGTRLAYERTGGGGGAPVALLDGISCDGFIWRDLRPALERDHPVLHMHYRGHGRSGLPRDPEACTIPHLAGDLAALLRRERLGPAVLIGHSMGVQVALETAWRHPEAVRALVLVCGSHGRVLDTFQHTDLGRRVLPALARVAGQHRDAVARVVRATLPTALTYSLAVLGEVKADLVSQADLMPYLEHFARMPLDLFLRTLTDASERESWAWLPRLAVPTLVIAGEDDGFTPALVSRELAGRIPGAELELVPGVSHTAPIERPDAIETAIRDFLRA